jgi:uncharacterized membrane protein YeaQ/YmgE (transglycosylase-associated protein family)
MRPTQRTRRGISCQLSWRRYPRVHSVSALESRAAPSSWQAAQLRQASIRSTEPTKEGRIHMLDIPNMTLLAWLIVGTVAGFLASVLTGARESLITMIVLGIVGAVVGGWVARDLLHIANVTGVNSTSIAVATVGAVLVIFVFGSLNRRGRYGWR